MDQIEVIGAMNECLENSKLKWISWLDGKNIEIQLKLESQQIVNLTFEVETIKNIKVDKPEWGDGV
jgi:hypothetical protein